MAVTITSATVTSIRRSGSSIEIVLNINPINEQRVLSFGGKPTTAEVQSEVRGLMTEIQKFLDFEEQAQAYVGVTINQV